MLQTDLATRVVYSTDNSIYQVRPAAVAAPGSSAEVSALLAANHRSAQPLPIVARGGSTGTNGQALTDGIVVDLKRSMHAIRSIDPVTRIAVVEPGVVPATLNQKLAPLGLRWAPHTSTIDRATVGGMIATDAAGKGSLVHGRTHRHVAAVDLCLADGTSVHLAPTKRDHAERIAAGTRTEATLWRSLLNLADEPPVTAGEPIGPAVARGWTGYGVDRLLHDDVINPVNLVAGAEGTLGVVTAAWLHLTPLPTATTTIVAIYESFDEALADSLHLRDTAPTAIEVFDEATLRAARASPAWSVIGDVVSDGLGDEADGAVLIIEYDDPSETADGLVATVCSSGRCLATLDVDDKLRRTTIWKMRADAVGFLARQVVCSTAADGTPRAARPTAMVEDCAVPVEAMPAFIAEFRRLLNEAGLKYGMFGHADVGCVHVRPALDLSDGGHRQLVGEVTDRVVDLVQAHGGVLWGEHGRGFRGESIVRALPSETINLMRQVKSAFDPDDLCNPGKLFRPLDSAECLIGTTDPPLRGATDGSIPVAVRTEHHSAFACNGNGLCHAIVTSTPMCPSYQATGDPSLSPKGRADLLRAWLAQRTSHGVADPVFEVAIAENLQKCLSCAACSGRCPVGVDIPELKSQFLNEYYEDRRRPLADLVLSRFERLAPIAARSYGFGFLLRPIERLLGLVDLPVPPRPAAVDYPRFDPTATDKTAVDVVVLADIFTSVFEPATLKGTINALTDRGYTVAVAQLIPSGKFDHVKGRRGQFARAAHNQRALVDAVVATGSQATVVEPSIALLHEHEYLEVVGSSPNKGVVSLARLLGDGRQQPAPTDHVRLTLLSHCTDRARRPEETERWVELLADAGHDVTLDDVGCCGMAGVFGHERANQQMSTDLWKRNWEPSTNEAIAAGRRIAATGWSCRSQAARHGVVIHHPIHLL